MLTLVNGDNGWRIISIAYEQTKTTLAMINFFVTWEHKYAVTSFLRTWSNCVGDVFRIVPYEYLSTIKRIQPGAFIFSDIDRLRPKQVRDVERFCDLIATEFDPSLIFSITRGDCYSAVSYCKHFGKRVSTSFAFFPLIAKEIIFAIQLSYVLRTSTMARRADSCAMLMSGGWRRKSYYHRRTGT